MECQQHPGTPMNMVCGESVCGSCYGEQLLTERMPKVREVTPVDLTFGLFGRDPHRPERDRQGQGA